MKERADPETRKVSDYVMPAVGGGSSVAFVLAYIADSLTIGATLLPVLKPVMVISSAGVFVSALYFLFRIKHVRGLSGKVTNLEQLACNGVKYTLNAVEIQFDVEQQKYRFTFEKRYIMLVDNAKWYSGQFYCNTILKDAQQSFEYYGHSPVLWKDLNVQADLQYKNPGDNDYGETHALKILNIADKSNYIPFHIQYTTVDDDVLVIKKGAEVKLIYRYDVPVTLWGSYLNRTVSYFDEDATILVLFKTGNRLRKDYFKLFELMPSDGTPVLIDRFKYGEGKTGQGDHTASIELPKRACGKYRIWWNAEEIFGERGLNTENTIDASQLTLF